MEDRKKIEAVLFAVGDKIEEAELSRLTKLPIEAVKAELSRLKEDYNQANSTFILLNEGTKWKLTVREDYMPIVQKIVPKTELSRPVLETLAVIAWKSPVLQSNIIDIRSSKAYDHISELEEVGFITKQKYGRSFMLRLSQQFFEYFDIKGKEGIKDVFKNIKGTEQIASPDKKLHEFGGEAAPELNIQLPMEVAPESALPVVQLEPDAEKTIPAVQEKAEVPAAATQSAISTIPAPVSSPVPASKPDSPAKPKKEKKPKPE